MGSEFGNIELRKRNGDIIFIVSFIFWIIFVGIYFGFRSLIDYYWLLSRVNWSIILDSFNYYRVILD